MNYDLIGHRTKVVENGVSVSYTANKLSQNTSVDGEPLSYDGYGNLTSAPGNAACGGFQPTARRSATWEPASICGAS